MVTGIVGNSCQEVTAAIEAQLGNVLSQATTADYYAQTNDQTLKVNQANDYHNW
jgi:hypothetical protein